MDLVWSNRTKICHTTWGYSLYLWQSVEIYYQGWSITVCIKKYYCSHQKNIIFTCRREWTFLKILTIFSKLVVFPKALVLAAHTAEVTRWVVTTIRLMTRYSITTGRLKHNISLLLKLFSHFEMVISSMGTGICFERVCVLLE